MSGSAGSQLVEALWCAHDLGINRPVVEQAAYHLLDRRAERELVPAALTHGTALTVWSPLAGGLLTGKYLDASTSRGARLSPDHAIRSARGRRRGFRDGVLGVLDAM